MKSYGRVLIAAPTSERHESVIDEWYKALQRQSYKKFDVLLVNTSVKPSFREKLERLNIDLVHYPWNPEKMDILQHLALCRELYRQVAVTRRYKYLFHLDTDTILPRKGLYELLQCDKDQVGYVVQVFPKGHYRPPCVFKEGGFKMNQKNPKKNGLQYYSWSWVSQNRNKLMKVYASALGVLLVKRKVFEKVPFRTHPTFINGEDLWYYAEAANKGFEAYCLVKRIPHKNVTWDKVVLQRKKQMKIHFAFGLKKAVKKLEDLICPPVARN